MIIYIIIKFSKHLFFLVLRNSPGLMMDSKLNYQLATNKMVQRGMATTIILCQLTNTQRGLRAKTF